MAFDCNLYDYLFSMETFTMTNAYKYAIGYFLAFSLLLIVSGTMLFEQKIGFSVNQVTEYYLGNEENFTVAKTFTGVLKVILPHLAAFGLISMVLLHFLIFTKYKDTKQLKYLTILLFSSAFLEVFSPFFILLGTEFFSYVKVASFIVLETLVLYISWLLFISLMKK